jgi:DNA-nicking Smr family endonuclease
MPKNQHGNNKKVWQQVTKRIKPLKTSKKLAPKIAQPRSGTTRTRHKAEPLMKQNTVHGDLLYVSKRRLKRPVIDAKIDLHGMRQMQAKEALFRFIEESSHQGCKTLLVITGKGLKTLLTEGAPGAIKQNFPAWLSDPHVHSLIQHYVPAHPKDGGSGAYYVVLRKRKPL